MVTCHVSLVTCHLSHVITRTGTSTEKIIENPKTQKRLEIEVRRADYIIHQKKNTENMQIRVFAYLKKSKSGFLIAFSKSDLAGVGYIFGRKIFLKKPNFLKYAQACRKLK